MGQNLISQIIPQTIIKDAEKNLSDSIAAFKPYATGLSPEQRHEMVKMGDKSVPYAEKVNGYLATNGDILPRRYDVAEFAKDYAIPRQLRDLRAYAATLLEMIDDTIMAAGSDAMMVCNAYYNAVQDAMHSGDAGAKAIYEDLKTRYPYTTGRRKTDK